MSKRIAVIGAGIVGVSTAIWLQRAGHQVVLIDREGPAAGTSHGNAGLLASCAVVPVTGPGLIRKAPGMVLSPRQPVFLKWRYLPRLAPWLVRFLSHANAADTTRIAAGLTPIIGDSLADHQALAAGTGAERFIVPCDYLFLYDRRKDYAAEAFGWDLRRQNGFQWQEWGRDQITAFDPALSPDLPFAARLADHGRITDPGAYVQALADHVVQAGGEVVTGTVERIEAQAGQVTGLRVDGAVMPAEQVVVASGIWSGPLARQLGLRLPLESERGYHLELWEPSVMPRAPVMISSGKCVLTPMEGRLRIAGTVELGGLSAPPRRAVFDLLRQAAVRALPGLRWSHEVEWMGHRPTLSDSLPVIGAAPGIKGAYLGFGHQHIGLTGGPKTGRLLAQMISGQRPNLDMAPYAPTRFWGAR